MAPSKPPSFFKVLMEPSSPHLPLPPDFVTKHLKNKIPNDPIIQSINGMYAWPLKIKKIGEIYFFDHGWNNVVKDAHLGFGDLLVFWFVDKSTFKMLVYSPNGCEKDLPPKMHAEHHDDFVVDDDDDDDVEDEDYEEKKDDDDDDDDLFFKSIVSKTHMDKLRLPGEFVGLGKIEGEGTIMMKDLEGREWPMVARLDKSYRAERYYISTGWRNFRRCYDLSEGDVCVFKFITSEHKLCLAKLTRTKRPAIQPPPFSNISRTKDMKRKTSLLDGWPPCQHDGDVEAVKRPHGLPHQQKTRVLYF